MGRQWVTPRPYRIVREDGQGLGLLPQVVRTEVCILEGALFLGSFAARPTSG